MKIRLMVLIGTVMTVTLVISLRTVAAAGEIPSASPAQGQIRINEFMASNSSVLEDPDEPGEFPDRIELYNPSASPVSLDGLYLIEGDPGDPVRFAISTGLSIPAQGFLVFFADDDPSQGKLHTNFRLNKDGGQIGLYGDEAATEPIDTYLYGPQEVDLSEARSPDGGNWQEEFSRPTPGRTNTVSPPLITEVTHSPALPSPDEVVEVTAVISDDGQIVEASLIYSVTGIQGDTAAPPSITVSMTLVSDNRYAAQIPAQSSGAMVYYRVTARDNDGLVAPDPDLVRISSYRYPVGYVKPDLVINEVMADNKSLLEDPDDPGDYPDWIELYNAGSSTVLLDGLFLTDRMSNPTKFAITDGLTLAPGAFVLFYADEQQEQGEFHTNFRLNDQGETVGLFGAEGSVEIDRLKYGQLTVHVAYGRYPDGPDGQKQILVCATPGETNILCDQKLFMPAITAE